MNKFIVTFVLSIILVGVAFAFVLDDVSAAPPKYPCVYKHKVAKADTLGGIAERYKIAPWDLVAANRYNILKPNYPVIVNDVLCIPEPLGSTRKLPAWILDQDAAWFIVQQNKQKLYITGYNFPTGQNYFVTVSQKGDKTNEKIGKVKIFRKVRFDKSFSLEKGYIAYSVCLKNQTYDTRTCSKVYHIP